MNRPKFIKEIISAIEYKKAFDVSFYDVSGKSVLTDYILVSSVNNDIHCRAILNEVETILKSFSSQSQSLGLNIPAKKHGNLKSNWIVLDANSLIIHILEKQQRDFYQLDDIFDKIVTS
tara:strand:+ start:49 stop:405 length:357 start_codon:yes stop_codon:yes gene_type:complete